MTPERKTEVRKAEGILAWGRGCAEIAVTFHFHKNSGKANHYRSIACLHFSRFRALMNSSTP